MSLSDSLTSLQQSLRSINSSNFNSPRMFTNAMVNAPEITTLIKDPTYDESSLYTINKPKNSTGRSKLVDNLVEKASMDTKSERIDGRIIYTLEPIVSDKPQQINRFINKNGEYIQREDDDDGDEEDRRTPIVKFPNLDLSNSTSRSLINLNNSEDLGQIFYQTSQVLSKYPNLIEDHHSLVRQLNRFEHEYRSLENEIQDLHDEVKERKKYLTEKHVDYDNVSFTNMEISSTSSDTNQEDELDIDEIIRLEREEIEQLESKLKQVYNK